MSHGSHDSMPSNIWPSASRSHCSRPHGCVATSALGAGADLVGREQLAAREDHDLVDVVGRALVGDRELREPVDLVAPEVDAHRDGRRSTGYTSTIEPRTATSPRASTWYSRR